MPDRRDWSLEPAQILSVDDVYSGFGQIERVRFRRMSRAGAPVTQDWEVYRRADCAAVLPYDPTRRTVLLIRQFRVPAFINGGRCALVEACAGLIDAGETPEACAIREAQEECGYRLTVLEPAGTYYTSPGALTERVHLFLARYTPHDRVSDGGGQAHEHEDIETFEVSTLELARMMDDGRIENAITGLLARALQVKQPGLFRP